MRRLMFFVLLAGLVCSIGIATAEPIRIEVAKAEASLDRRSNEPVISLTLTDPSARMLAQLTQENVGRPMHLRVDGKVVITSVIREPILRGFLQISGSFSSRDVKDIADSIRSGSKVEVELVSQ